MLSRYNKAASLMPDQLLPLLRNRTVEPMWTGPSTFRYRRQIDDGTEVVEVDCLTGARTVVLDLPAVAPVNPLLSSDGKQELFVRDHDVWVRDVATSEERLVLADGEEHFAWGALPDNNMIRIPTRRSGAQVPPFFTGFSPSGRYVVSARIDERGMREWPFVDHLPTDQARPQVFGIRNVLEDEEPCGDGELAIADLANGTVVTTPLTEELSGSLVSNGVAALTWSTDEQSVFAFSHKTGGATGSLVEISVTTGEVRIAVTETDSPGYEANTYLYSLPLIRVLPEVRQAIWFSQRDGWGHLYRYDLDTGECLNRITSGHLVVRDLLRVTDTEVFFLAGCGDDGHNPYWRKLYRAALDGSSQELLTPEACDHALPAPAPQFFSLIFAAGAGPRDAISPDGQFFVDHMSTVSEPPVIVLRSTVDGTVITELERTDVSALLEAGYVIPTMVSVPVDGTTVWGIVTVPPGDGPFPVVDLMYAGFQVATAPVAFFGPESGGAGRDQLASAYAALGLATVVLDGRGTSGRERVFRSWTQGQAQTTRGLEDHVIAIRELAPAFNLDISRVGVTGHSYGGYNSARAILQFPDFFTAAVSSAGVHVPEKMPHGMWTWHLGEASRDSDVYRALSNLPLAPQLKGKLLLLYGDLDENATLDHTLALADALMQAGKRFDMKLWPGYNHYQTSAYTQMCTWDHFVKHLLGVEPPEDYVPATSVTDRSAS